MAIVKLSSLIEEVHGQVGGLVFRRGPNGQTFVSGAPRKKRPKSKKAQRARKAQNEQQKKRMESAHDYAHSAMANAETKAYYEQIAKKEKKSAYHLALSHYFKVQRELEK